MEEATTKPERPKRGIQTLVVALALGTLLAIGGVEWKQQRDEFRAEKQQLSDENEKLSESLQSIRSESDESNATLEEVAKGLEEIRVKELKAIQSSIQVAREGDAAAGRRQQLGMEIQAIRDAIHKNLQKLARLEKTSRESGVKMASLEKLADELKRSLEEKAATVSALESRVGDLSKTVEAQASSLAEKDAALVEKETRIVQKTKEANTAYVAVASKNVLKEKGVVERKGSILGLGGRWTETGKFDPEVFREIDVSKELEVSIPAPASRVHIVSEQPKESYEIVDNGPDSGSSRLSVKDPAAFWKGERYLVVMIRE
ncbi:MAG: hypothetical protein ACHQPI_01460 [Thermoanaerobaculia bacterium]